MGSVGWCMKPAHTVLKGWTLLLVDGCSSSRLIPVGLIVVSCSSSHWCIKNNNDINCLIYLVTFSNRRIKCQDGW